MIFENFFPNNFWKTNVSTGNERVFSMLSRQESATVQCSTKCSMLFCEIMNFDRDECETNFLTTLCNV